MAADAQAILADPRYVVVPAAPCGDVGTMAWLRGAVSRFVSGPEHERRRALVEAELRGLDPAWLRARARREAASVAAPPAGAAPPGVAAPPSPAALAIPVRVLAAGLGVPAAGLEGVVSAVAAIAPGYPAGARPEDQLAADRAVASLVALFGPAPAVATARISVLVQAHSATGALISRAIEVASRRSPPADALLDETLRTRPPVPVTRRVGPDGTVVVDLARHPFGFGPRACPGIEHALALAAGVLEGLGYSRLL